MLDSIKAKLAAVLAPALYGRLIKMLVDRLIQWIGPIIAVLGVLDPAALEKWLSQTGQLVTAALLILFAEIVRRLTSKAAAAK